MSSETNWEIWPDGHVHITQKTDYDQREILLSPDEMQRLTQEIK
jgi:hypothetical protein